MSAIKKGDIEKVSKMANKGVDPNFIDLEFGGGKSGCHLTASGWIPAKII